MDELFYVDNIDTRCDVLCFILHILVYFLLCCIALIMLVQMFCSLMYIAKGIRAYTAEDTQDQVMVMVMVPCYNEGGLELIKTLDSVLTTTYPEENKAAWLLADGVVTGTSSDMSTPPAPRRDPGLRGGPAERRPLRVQVHRPAHHSPLPGLPRLLRGGGRVPQVPRHHQARPPHGADRLRQAGESGQAPLPA